MPDSLRITVANPDPALLDLPWHIPLAEWPASLLAALPRGLSRHVVRFVKLSGRVVAVKEIAAHVQSGAGDAQVVVRADPKIRYLKGDQLWVRIHKDEDHLFSAATGKRLPS